MEKENLSYVKASTSTKIPLPLEPLPQIPMHLRKFISENAKESIKRRPLKTLNSQDGTSGQHSQRNTKGTPLKINSRHITVRKDNYDLDWKYDVFNSQLNIDTYDEIALDNNVEEDLIRFSSDSKSKTKISIAKAVTPAEVSPTVEHNRIRNIKRSLKRPHSRELQGLACNKVVKLDEFVKPRQAHKDRIFDRLRSPDDLKKIYINCLSRDYSMDMLQYLLLSERKTPRVLFIEQKSRACLVNWLMKVNGADGNPAIIESACWYLDTLVSKEIVRTEKIQLVASACYWIAQKLHGPSMSAAKLAQFSNMAFHPNELIVAESVILNKLKFPTYPVVTHDFLPYFAWQCDSEHPGEIEVVASFICLSGLMVRLDLASEYPSVVAAAAVRNALMLLKRTQLMPKLLFCPIYRQAEAKCTNFQATCLAQRNAIRTVACSKYEYRVPYEHYGAPPFYIAKKIVKAACNFSVNDARQKSVDV